MVLMTNIALSGCRILVVEDRYFIAMDIVCALSQVGARIVGPVATLSDTMSHVENGGFDFAVMNIELRDGVVFPAADRLKERGIPFAFMSGYDRQSIPERFSAIDLCQKPYKNSRLIELLCGHFSTTGFKFP
jgi:two-component SAPR family response regulator